MNKQEFWSAANVSEFQGFTVTNGEVDLTDSEYADYLDECYESVYVAGQTFQVSDILKNCDPVAWRCGMGDRESELQAELEQQLENEDDSDIEFIEELDEEDDEE